MSRSTIHFNTWMEALALICRYIPSNRVDVLSSMARRRAKRCGGSLSRRKWVDAMEVGPRQAIYEMCSWSPRVTGTKWREDGWRDLCYDMPLSWKTTPEEWRLRDV